MAAASSDVEFDEDQYGFIVAYRFRGSDLQQTLPVFVAWLEEDIGDLLVEQSQVGDAEVTLLRSSEQPDGDQLVLLARGDVTCFISVPAQLLEEAVGSLPES
jgi:hypothetical protein